MKELNVTWFVLCDFISLRNYSSLIALDFYFFPLPPFKCYKLIDIYTNNYNEFASFSPPLFLYLDRVTRSTFCCESNVRIFSKYLPVDKGAFSSSNAGNIVSIFACLLGASSQVKDLLL